MMELRIGFDQDTSIHLLDAPVFVEDNSSELADSCKYLLLSHVIDIDASNNTTTTNNNNTTIYKAVGTVIW